MRAYGTRAWLVVHGFAALVLTACGDAPAPPPADTATDPAEVEALVADFYDRVEAGDYEGLRAIATSDFEIVDGGLRMDLPGFESFLDEVFAQGVELDFALDRFSTVIDGAVAYTTLHAVNQTVDRAFHETMILRRIDGEWKVDRFHSTPVRAQE